MPVRLITAPALEPVSLTQAKAQLRLETSDDDVLIGTMIAAARAYTEQACGRAMVTQTFELVTDSFAGVDTLELGARMMRTPFAAVTGRGTLPWIELPMGSVGEVGSIVYVDAAGSPQTLASSVYTVDTASKPARLMLAYGQNWPNTREQWDAVKVRYTAGWGFIDDVWQGPPNLTQAMLLLLSQMYETRVPAVLEPGTTYDALIDPHRIIRL